MCSKAVLQPREEMSFDAGGEMLAAFPLPLPQLGRIDRDPMWTECVMRTVADTRDHSTV